MSQNSLKLTGTVLSIGKKTNFKEKEYQEFVIKYLDGNFDNTTSFQASGRLLDTVSKLKLDQYITVHFNSCSRESNGKWYTNNRAWKIDLNN